MINDQEKKLGEALVAANVLTPTQLSDAIVTASAKNTPSLIVGLLEAGYLSFKVFEKFLLSSANIKATIIGNRKIRPDILNLVPTSLIIANAIFPMDVKSVNEDKSLILGMVDPLNSDAIEAVRNLIKIRVLPILISLPDFKQTVKNHFGTKTEEIDLEGVKDDEKVVLIRPGGYEEEIAFQQAEKTRAPTRTTGRQEVELEGFSSSTRQSRQAFPYFGENSLKLKEEILLKLDLQGSDAKIFNRDKYSREVLYKELQEVSLKKLEALYPKLNAMMKFEAFANALIDKGVLNKRDIIVSCAISYLFGEAKL